MKHSFAFLCVSICLTVCLHIHADNDRLRLNYALALPSSVLGVRGKNDVAGEQVHEGRCAVNGARGRESQWMPNIASMTGHYKSFFTADGGQRIAKYEAETVDESGESPGRGRRLQVTN